MTRLSAAFAWTFEGHSLVRCKDRYWDSCRLFAIPLFITSKSYSRVYQVLVPRIGAAKGRAKRFFVGGGAGMQAGRMIFRWAGVHVMYMSIM